MGYSTNPNPNLVEGKAESYVKTRGDKALYA